LYSVKNKAEIEAAALFTNRDELRLCGDYVTREASAIDAPSGGKVRSMSKSYF
jgi:hypothetical protein